MIDVNDQSAGGVDEVETLLKDLAADADKWEALIAAEEDIQFEVKTDLVHAVGDVDGGLIGLRLHPSVMDMSYVELQDHLNAVFAALREQAEDEFVSSGEVE